MASYRLLLHLFTNGARSGCLTESRMSLPCVERFESVEAALEYIKAHGLQCNEYDLQVYVGWKDWRDHTGKTLQQIIQTGGEV